MAIKLGLFMMPNHPPTVSINDAHDFDIETIVVADQLGYQEVWVGEHFTAPWEPIPSPDILIAQALLKTKNIRLGAGAHLLPYHHPVELAQRISYLDHLSKGRLLVGIGAGGLPSDAEIFNVDIKAGENRAMTREALDIMLFLWDQDTTGEFNGKFWTVRKPDPKKWEHVSLRHFLLPYQNPYPPIGLAGSSFNSGTLKVAGEKGFIPMSVGAGGDFLKSHWNSVSEGALKSGLKPDRQKWRVLRDIWVADTDEEAINYARKGMLSRAWREYLLPLFKSGENPTIHGYKHDLSVKTEDVNVDYMLEHIWIVGSPETVANKIRELFEISGGFGVLLGQVLDYSENKKNWHKSLRLLSEKVIPSLEDLKIND